jgi:Spy/CpxP family protein refolding chaperone
MNRDRELRRRLTRSLGCLCALVLLPLVAAAQPPYGGPERGPGGGAGWDPLRVFEANADELDLDEQTRASIRARIDASQEERKRLEAAVRELYQTLQRTLEEDAPDRDAVMAVVDSLGRTEIELRKHRIDTLLEVHALLTPEQGARARELRMRRPHHGGRARMRDSCHDDAQKLCADEPRGRARFDCLREHEAELSPACREALQSGPGRRGGAGSPPGAGGAGGERAEP